MGNTQVGKLHKNRIVKDLNGNIIDWYDEAHGGWIVKSRGVVNQERWNEHVQKEKDKQEAAKAISEPKIRNDFPETKDGMPEQTKVEALEKRIDGLDDKLEAILKAVLK